MAVIGADDEAEATKGTGEADVDPGAGELIVTPAKADVASTRFAITNRTKFCTKTFLLQGLRFLH
jgi:hypothetical protein